ncbi:MAG: hypothetical protein Fur0028_15520 [Bacteroidales bacterium]
MKKKYKIHSENPWLYIQNARQILKEKAGKDEEFYIYPKYVRMAGHTAYMGVLITLNELMQKEGFQKRGRKKVEDYIDFLAKRNRKILNYFNEVYEILHLYMGYDGGLNSKVCNIGIEYAEKIIEWVETQLGKKWNKQEK